MEVSILLTGDSSKILSLSWRVRRTVLRPELIPILGRERPGGSEVGCVGESMVSTSPEVPSSRGRRVKK